MPAYGQVLLAETMGSLVYILIQLHVQHQKRKAAEELAKEEKDKSSDPMIRALMIGIAYFAMQQTFRNVTGGPLNPAISLA